VIADQNGPIEPPSPLNALASIQIGVLMEEYKTLRAESLQSIQARHQVITFAFGALSVIIAGIVTSNASSLLLGFMSFAAVPQIAKAVLFMWLGEYRRSARAGNGLRAIEEKINALVGQNTLSWETSLSAGRSHMTYPYSATVFVILLISYIGLVIGISEIAVFTRSYSPALLWECKFNLVAFVTIALVILAVAIELTFWVIFQRRWVEAKTSNYGIPSK
jgi:hypothetical protein